MGFHGTQGTPSIDLPLLFVLAYLAGLCDYFNFELATYIGEHSYADYVHVLGCAALLLFPCLSKLALLKLPMGQIIGHIEYEVLFVSKIYFMAHTYIY